MAIDHLGIFTTEELFDQTLAIYLAALKPLGYEKRTQPFKYAVGLGTHGSGDFWIAAVGKTPTKDLHFAFTAECEYPSTFPSRTQQRATQLTVFQARDLVDQCYKEAIAAGAEDNGAPGVRAMYGPDYYGAFFKDPAGNNAEIVCKKPA